MRKITIAHTPDSDDAFMFYALTQGIVKPTAISIVHELTNMQSLNEAAAKGKYEMSALSFAAYPGIADKYFLMNCGACMGNRTGPILLAKQPIAEDKISQLKIAVPGTLTTAYLLLKIYCPSASTISMPFDSIISAVTAGSAQAGLIIDGGQMTYTELGLHKIFDFGEWWYEQTQLPLPLGGNIIRKDLPPAIIFQLTELFRESIQYALTHRREAVRYAMRYAQSMNEQQAMQFIGRFVNELTLDYGEIGKQAIDELFRRGHAAGLLPEVTEAEFA